MVTGRLFFGVLLFFEFFRYNFPRIYQQGNELNLLDRDNVLMFLRTTRVRKGGNCGSYRLL